MKKLIYFIILIIIFLGKDFAVAEDLHIDITKTHSAKVRIAIPDFSKDNNSDEDLSQEIAKILRNDLKISGFFAPLENLVLFKEIEELDRESNQINFEKWVSLGAETLVKGSCFLENKKLTIKYRLYNLTKKKQIGGKLYRGDRNLLRKMVHRISDEIILKFTGKKGVCQTKIAFVSDISGYKEIYIVDFDGYNLQRLTWDRSITLTPSWSPKGKEIVYTTYKKGNPDLYLLNIEKGISRQFSIFPGLNVTASWSPKGDCLALTLSKDGNVEIYIINKKGNSQRLTHHHRADSSPSWSPNGKEIVFTSDRSGSPQLYIMNRKGKKLRRLTYKGSYNDSAEWSPRGNTIAFTSWQEGSFDICLTDGEGENFKRLTINPGNEENPSWSPDERYIAFSSQKGEKSNIYIINSDGWNERQLTFCGGNNYSPSWSPRIK